MKKFCLLFVLVFSASVLNVTAQQDSTKSVKKSNGKSKIQYGLASFYSNKFNGRKTANGEIFSNQKLTAAHNTLPLGTYVRVTNLRNKRSVVVKINDRLHHKNKRIIDLSRLAATKLGFIKSGLTRVKVEVLGKKPPSK
ncbi:septal ring lytic transglycosylase RlpA family protein [Lacibacter sp. H375]|uniref:septal ring lytic transglycosylase RlpA family protein n=1 Tax=Lacibacter sp. H375 TaxID=3133424 RepID=UPI0030C6266A